MCENGIKKEYKVVISIDEDILSRVKVASDKAHLKRSDFLRLAIARFLEGAENE
jgi:metal-responsive CopG/Arc/MetJ family transcriptional regulator